MAYAARARKTPWLYHDVWLRGDGPTLEGMWYWQAICSTCEEPYRSLGWRKTVKGGQKLVESHRLGMDSTARYVNKTTGACNVTNSV